MSLSSGGRHDLVPLSTHHDVPTHQKFALFPSSRMPTGACVCRNREVELKLLKKYEVRLLPKAMKDIFRSVKFDPSIAIRCVTYCVRYVSFLSRAPRWSDRPVVEGMPKVILEIYPQVYLRADRGTTQEGRGPGIIINSW